MAFETVESMINETADPIDFTDCKGVGAHLVGNECACGPFSVFDENQECQCIDGHMRFGNKACIMCAGVGANLNEFGVCTCAEHSVLRFNRDTNQLHCECQEGFFTSNTNVNTCFKCVGGVFDPDTNDCTCEGAGKIFNAETKRWGCKSLIFVHEMLILHQRRTPCTRT